MSISRDTDSGVYVTTYEPARILIALGIEGAKSTAEVEELLGSSRSTARRKLRRLKDLGVVTHETVGDSYRWSLVDNPPMTGPASLPPAEVESLLTDALIELAARLELPTDCPAGEVTDWIAQRGVPDEIATATYARRLAVFHRLLRSTLLGLHIPEHASVKPLDPNEDWSARFSAGSELIDEAGLVSTPLDKLLGDCDTELNAILLALRRPMLGLQDPATVLSSVYEALVSPDARRSLGQFATPPFVGQFMASWTVQAPDDTILDPGIGAGQLATCVLRAKLAAGADNPLADITGIDVDPIAITMASVALKLVDGPGHSQLSVADFIATSPRTFTEDGVETEYYDGVITNPPYSRHQALNAQMKDGLADIVARETDYEFSQRTPLYGYFLVHAAQFLEKGGRLAAIVPSKFLDTKFGRDLKRYLQAKFTIHGIVQFDDDIEVFDDVRIRPSVLLLEKGVAPEDHKIQFIRLTDWHPGFDAEVLIKSDVREDPAVGTSTTIAQRLIEPTERWSFYLDGTDTHEYPGLTAFEEIADINRGIATGNNGYFCLTQEEVEEYDIPQRYRRRIIRTARGLDQVVIDDSLWKTWRDDGDAVWLLYCWDESGDEPEVIELADIESPGVREYLETVPDETMSRTLISRREPWFRVESQTPADILGKYMNRTGFLFMRNDANLRTVNNVHGISLKFDKKEQMIDALLAYLNSTVMERVLSKESHDYNGLQKLEVGQLNGAPVIDPRELSPAKIEQLAELFGELETVRREDRDDTAVLAAIDSELEQLLGLTDT